MSNVLFVSFQGKIRVSPQDTPPGVRGGVRRQVHPQAAARRGHHARDPARGRRASALRGLHTRRQTS